MGFRRLACCVMFWVSTQCGLLTTYDGKYLYQKWLWQSIVVWTTHYLNQCWTQPLQSNEGNFIAKRQRRSVLRNSLTTRFKVRDFCPDRGPSGELIAQYWPPMSFCFYPTLYLGNHLYFLKHDRSWKQQRNTVISERDSVHSTKRVVMVTPQHLLVTS